jgi:hypothetical protein
MSDDESDLHRVDTVPPPEGDDAYNAPTRVGVGPDASVLDAMRVAAATGRPLKPPTIPAPKESPVTPEVHLGADAPATSGAAPVDAADRAARRAPDLDVDESRPFDVRRLIVPAALAMLVVVAWALFRR